MRTAFEYEIDLLRRHGISGRHAAVKQIKTCFNISYIIH